MNILVACEESQIVCKSFREKGHNAFSCDIVECSGGHPEWHIKQDVLPLLDGNCAFATCDGKLHHIKGKWDMILAFPPCTHLTCSGQWAYTKGYKNPKLKEDGVHFFMRFVYADCDKICIENPIGVMSTRWRKPDQIIQPYYFGDEGAKKHLFVVEEFTFIKTH